MHCMIKETFFFIIHTYTHAHLLQLFSFSSCYHLMQSNLIWCNPIPMQSNSLLKIHLHILYTQSLLILICSFIYKCILFHLNFNQFTENNCVNLLFSFMYLYSHASNSDIMIKIKTWLNSCLLPITTNNILKFLWKSRALISGIKFTLHMVSNSDFHWVLPLSK